MRGVSRQPSSPRHSTCGASMGSGGGPASGASGHNPGTLHRHYCQALTGRALGGSRCQALPALPVSPGLPDASSAPPDGDRSVMAYAAAAAPSLSAALSGVSAAAQADAEVQNLFASGDVVRGRSPTGAPRARTGRNDGTTAVFVLIAWSRNNAALAISAGVSSEVQVRHCGSSAAARVGTIRGRLRGRRRCSLPVRQPGRCGALQWTRARVRRTRGRA